MDNTTEDLLPQLPDSPELPKQQELSEQSELPELPEPTYPLSATVGEPLAEGIEKAEKESIITALKAVQDPELMFDIYEMGLIYDIIQEDNGNVKIIMTLTSPTCPIAGDMPTMVAHAVSSVQGVGQVTVELTFDPPWTIDRLSDEIKLLMGF